MRDRRAALFSILLPGLGHAMQRRGSSAATSFIVTIVLIAASLALGRVSGRASEVFFFMLFALPWWTFQSYDAYLGPPPESSPWRRTWGEVWRQGQDIRFLGLLLLISAVIDSWIIAMNLDYLLPFYCTKPDGLVGFLAKAISPALHVVVGFGFIALRRWGLFAYLIYAAYGFTNGMVNLGCFGPGRIRNSLLVAIIISTMYLLWR
ncbi:MAG TPA: hypothetical protein VIR79_04410, partial [Nitrospira sp.]